MRHSGGRCRHSQEMQDQDFYAFKQLSTGLWVRIEGKWYPTACAGYPRKQQCCVGRRRWGWVAVSRQRTAEQSPEDVGTGASLTRRSWGSWSCLSWERHDHVGKNWNRKFHLNMGGNFFTGWLSTRAVCPERPWGLLPCWYSQSSWRQSCVTCWSWTCFSRGIGPGCFKLQPFCPSLCTSAWFTSGWFSSGAPGCLSAPEGWGFVPLCWFV